MSDISEAAERLRELALEMGELTDEEYHEVGAELHTISQQLHAEYPADDAEPVTEEWLEAVGFSLGTLYASILLPVVYEGAAIVELRIGQDGRRGWDASLVQGVPDDLHRSDDLISLTSLPPEFTRGDVRRLCRALGITLEE